MLSLIAGYDHISALIPLPPRVPRYFQGQEKTHHIAVLGPDL